MAELLEVLRGYGFHFMNRVSRPQFDQWVGELADQFEAPGRTTALARQRLQGFLNHVTETTPFYRTHQGVQELKDLPVVKKSLIQERYGEFFSAMYRRSELYKTHTSGSYGTPMDFYHSREKRDRRFTEIIFFNRWTGYRVGMKHAVITVFPVRSRLKQVMQNAVTFVQDVLDEHWLEGKRKALIERKIKWMVGNPSTLHLLADYCQHKGDDSGRFALKGITSTAEPLYEPARAAIQDVFGCPVLSRYATLELGVIAHECAAAKRHHLNLASYLVEVLALDKDEPAGAGVPGRVVVTDLFSHAMPLVRYDTGDLAVLGGHCNCGLKGPVLDTVEGRQVEMVFNTSGERAAPLRLVQLCSKTLEGVRQFQFVQHSRAGYTLRLDTTEAFDRKKVRTLKEHLIDLLGQDARIEIEYVASIPPLSSGKRPVIINEYLRSRHDSRNRNASPNRSR